MNPKLFWLITVILLVCIHRAEAQQARKIPRVGFLAGSGDISDRGRNAEAFRQGLHELGYIEGKNIVVDYRYGEGNEVQFLGLVAELMKLNVDVLVIPPLTAIREAKRATKTIPIVMVTTQDPVAAGIIV